MAGLDFGLVGGDRQEYTEAGEALVRDKSKAHEYAEKTPRLGAWEEGIYSNMYNNDDGSYYLVAAYEWVTLTFDIGEKKSLKLIEGMVETVTDDIECIMAVEISDDDTTYTSVYQGVPRVGTWEHRFSEGNTSARYVRLNLWRTGGGVGPVTCNVYDMRILLG